MMNISKPTLSNNNEWQTSCVAVKERGSQLFESHYADIELIVGTEKVSIKAHKLFLRMASPLLEALLSTTENDEPIVISDVDPEAFKALLRYIYTDEINLDTFDYAHKVYLCATKYLLPQLAQVCSSYMACNITPTTACKAYELGMLYDEKVIQKESLLVISLSIDQILAHESFLEADFDTVVKIFSIEDLTIFSELELLKALEIYAEAWPGGFKKRKGLHQREGSVKKIKPDEVSNTDDNNEEKNEKGDAPDVAGDAPDVAGDALDVAGDAPDVAGDAPDVAGDAVDVAGDAPDVAGDAPDVAGDAPDLAGDAKDCSWVLPALQQIRFLTMSAGEFARRAAGSPLLGRRLALQLLANIASANTKVPMPEGYSTSREIRNTVEKYGPQLAPPIPAPSPEFQYTWELDVGARVNYSQTSETFKAGGLRWEVKMLPLHEDATTGPEVQSSYIGFFVSLVDGGRCKRIVPPPRQCRAKVEFRLLSWGGADVVRTFDKVFTTYCPNWGFSRFVSIEDMKNKEKGFLRHNFVNLVVRVLAQIEKQPRKPSKLLI